MMRISLALMLLLWCAPAWAVETWFFRSTAGAACGPGTRGSLNQTAGSSATTIDITGEDTWNRTESPARTIATGDWTVTADISTGAGKGAGNKVTCVVERRNSSCVVQTELVNATSNMTAETTCATQTFSATGVAQEAFSDGDILTVRCVRSAGGRTQDLCYDGASGGNSDSRLVHPDEASGRRRTHITISRFWDWFWGPVAQASDSVPALRTGAGLFVGTRDIDIPRLCQFVPPGSRFLDLGSGNGKVVDFARFICGADAWGVEYDADLVAASFAKSYIHHDDFFNVDFRDYDVLYYYVEGADDEARLIEKLAYEWSGTLLLYYYGAQSPFQRGFDALPYDRFELYPNLVVLYREER